MGLEGGTKKEQKEKIPPCESIGHRPFRGRCPKTVESWSAKGRKWSVLNNIINLGKGWQSTHEPGSEVDLENGVLLFLTVSKLLFDFSSAILSSFLFCSAI